MLIVDRRRFRILALFRSIVVKRFFTRLVVRFLCVIRDCVLRQNFTVDKPVHKQLERFLITHAVFVHVRITNVQERSHEIALVHGGKPLRVFNDRLHRIFVSAEIGIAFQDRRDVYVRYDLRQILFVIRNDEITARCPYREHKPEKDCRRLFDCVFLTHKIAPIFYRELLPFGVTFSGTLRPTTIRRQSIL